MKFLEAIGEGLCACPFSGEAMRKGSGGDMASCPRQPDSLCMGCSMFLLGFAICRDPG